MKNKPSLFTARTKKFIGIKQEALDVDQTKEYQLIVDYIKQTIPVLEKTINVITEARVALADVKVGDYQITWPSDAQSVSKKMSVLFDQFIDSAKSQEGTEDVQQSLSDMREDVTYALERLKAGMLMWQTVLEGYDVCMRNFRVALVNQL